MSDDIKTKIIHYLDYLAQRPDFEGVSTRDIEICNWVADQLKSQLDKAQSDLLECKALLERERKCVELAVDAIQDALEQAQGFEENIKFYEENQCLPTKDEVRQTEITSVNLKIALTKIKSLREK